MSDRLEIRLDPERRRRLDQLAQRRHASISDLVRALLDREYEEWLGSERMRVARVISALSIEDVPKPGLLDQQLEQAYDPPLH